MLAIAVAMAGSLGSSAVEAAPAPADASAPAAADEPTPERRARSASVPAIMVTPSDVNEDDPSSGLPPDVAVSDALSVDPGATCLEHDRLTEQVVTWLGRDEVDPRLTVVVEGDLDADHTLVFTLHDRGEVIAERVFSPGPSRCDDLHSVVALAIALALDATVLESVGIVPEPVPEPERERTPERELAPIVPRPEAPPASPGPDLSTPPDRPWRVRVRAGGLVTLGLPPPLGGGPEIGLELGWRELVDLQVGVMGATSGPQPVDQDATLRIALWAGRADVCVGPALGRLRPRACGGLIAGSALGEGRGFGQNYQVVVPWVALAVGGDLRVALTRRLALSLDLDAVLSTVQPVFDVYEELGVRKLRDLPRFGGMLGAGLVIALGEGRSGARP